MKLHQRMLTGAATASVLVLGAAAAGQGAASAATLGHAGTYTCTGTLAAPGELAGNYDNLVIGGTCAVQTGPVHVSGNLTVGPNGILNAVFGADDSSLSVGGNMVVQQNASVLLGCDTVFTNVWGLHHPLNVPSFPCIDDPNPSAPTFSSHDTVSGNVVENQPLGVVLNNVSIGGNLTETGGGGGPGCHPSGVFGQDLFFPPYSGYLDSTVGGNVTVTNLNTCWFGMLRVKVGGNVVNSNIANGDPDGNEDVGNIIHGNFVCQGNSPADQWGDADGVSNQVAGNATGMCGFGVTVPNPAPEAGVIGVTPVQIAVSVPLS